MNGVHKRLESFLSTMGVVILLCTGPALLTACGGGSGGGAGNLPVNVVIEKPEYVMHLPGQTGWFAPPAVYDLDNDGSKELIVAQYDLFVYDDQGALIDGGTIGNGRVYAPHVVADLEDDGTMEIVLGRGSEVIAYEWTGQSLFLKAGWPADTTCGTSSPEVRGMAAQEASERLLERGFVARHIPDPNPNVRASTHIFNTEEELEATAEAVSGLRS